MTTLAPEGVFKKYEKVKPIKKHNPENTAAKTHAPRKRLHTRMALKAGKVIRLEISIAPNIRIPSTMVMAVRNASSI